MQLDDGHTSGGVAGAITDNGTLAFNRSEDVKITNAVTGTGGFDQMGSGKTLLSGGYSGLTGASKVSGGTIEVLGRQLQGTGTIGTTANAAGGIIAPDKSIGTLTVHGDYIGQGGMLAIETELGGDDSDGSARRHRCHLRQHRRTDLEWHQGGVVKHYWKNASRALSCQFAVASARDRSMPTIHVMKCLIAALVFSAVALPHAAGAQSFDCRKAETDTEWAICNTPELGKLDTELATTYKQLLTSGGAVDFRGKVEQMQVSWIHGQRDLCGGNVDCLTRAYNAILTALNGLAPAENSASSADPAGSGVVPDCGTQGSVKDDLLPRAIYAKEICGRADLFQTVRQIDVVAKGLRSKLRRAWQPAFDAQQAAFPNIANMCPPEAPKLTNCIATAVEQRLQDVENLASVLDKPLPECAASDVTIKDSDLGDAGMSQALNVYLIEYSGTQACMIRGYPAISVIDAKGRPQPGYASYSSSSTMSKLAVPPLPVVLSPKSRTAWFAVHTASACDPGVAPLKVKMALPHSQTWIRTVEFPNAACPSIAVMPVGMISTLLSSIF
ncbi:hypothetical protein C5748_05630 [Phyllobacterium phragmitis]|uniref:Lysozyme inhibitor LprI N-terminal domain-containing protein n=1 Tax=Phyllobacterium phragmitis TaxID=2670329 RepID=A0A2S9IWE7_9HYPH|nr:hypothetical protein [Phyllobacterium phragmitis]PRD44856.1 hypothetical protein C5748_05630 [Phyllobacterium phragmitis]